MDEDRGAMAIHGGHPRGVHQYYTATIAPSPSAPHNFSLRGGADGRPQGSSKIDASVHAGITQERMGSHPEARADPIALHRAQIAARPGLHGHVETFVEFVPHRLFLAPLTPEQSRDRMAVLLQLLQFLLFQVLLGLHSVELLLAF